MGEHLSWPNDSSRTTASCGHGAPFYRSEHAECYECYITRRSISGLAEFEEILGPPTQPRQSYTAPAESVPDLYERKIILALLRWPELAQECPELAELDTSWFSKATHQRLWREISEAVRSGPGGASENLARFLERFDRSGPMSPERARRLIRQFAADPMSAPARVNARFYAACVAGASPQPWVVQESIRRRLRVLDACLGGAA